MDTKMFAFSITEEVTLIVATGAILWKSANLMACRRTTFSFAVCVVNPSTTAQTGLNADNAFSICACDVYTQRPNVCAT
jgi:hypothetical protein